MQDRTEKVAEAMTAFKYNSKGDLKSAKKIKEKAKANKA